MRVLKQVLDFYINASIHVALAVCAFVKVTELYFGLTYNESLDFFLFFGTITGYNFVKYVGVAKLHHRSLTTHLKIIQIFSLICFLLMCFYAIKLNVKTLLVFVPFGLLTFLYAVPFFSGFQKNLRSIGYLKIIIVAFVWAGATVFLPVYDANVDLSNQFYITIIQRFLLVMVLILPFDIRDVKYDAVSLQTIPKKIGIEKTKKLGYILLVFCLLLEFMIAPNASFRTVFLLIFMTILILLMRSSEKKSKYYSAFIVESIPIVWWLLLSIV
ncbi:hypothetical protein RRF68_00415 [Tenacibaculum sp. HL-MS23]|uniref:hypothetical protein n=1 Tax=Tenacibaculum TaxID=104267 RepID=UPI001C4FF01F|nr:MULTISPECIES: hypothetical protein [Tenacibaculum]QXP74275.1 hypothetical protein H0I30_03765 [Tenacibaculum sp. AHE14PA]QXP75355.1 hypothetical protein H0I31_09205 [Tenacibaculum sp. AHE15PA]WNW01909.1 hypothetical protein RRF68_00415 [Tenacibaculum sp. HL-MS23]